MNVSVRLNNINLPEKTRAFAEEKLNRLARYMPNIQSIHLDLSHQSYRKGPAEIVAQITVRHARGALIRAEEKLVYEDDRSIVVALNKAVDTMQVRISRFKGKKRSKRERLRDRYQMTQEEMTIAEDFPEEGSWEVPDAEQQEAQIYRRKTVAVNPMNEEEAIEQMELLGHTFFMFLNADTNLINIMYKRSHGGYGVLVPDVE